MCQEKTLNTDKKPQGEHLFSFVIVADTHVNEAEGVSPSPFATNAMANERARHVFSEIATIEPRPEFVIHLGDMVHPVPSLPTFEDATACFKEIISLAKLPVHVVPGNHDIGDKSIDWMPADIVCQDYVEKYREIFGPDYFSFERGDIKFLCINALLLNSGLESEDTQKQWIDAEITGTDKRIFIFTHYPPYVFESRERSTYDNIDEPGRSWLLERMRCANVEAVFAGHVHNFWYDVVGRAEMYLLPSTAFLRHDFAEFYRAAPGFEYGRGDTDKFGYFVVDVYERGHVAQLIRTHGDKLKGSETFRPKQLTAPVHTKTSGLAGVGVEMRHAWTEVVQIPCTGGVQEFGRKPVRNDYQLMVLWEIGMRTLKVPEQDLRDPATLARARLMSDVGHDFIVTALGVPQESFLDDVLASGVALSAIELNLSMEKMSKRTAQIARLKRKSGARIIFSKLRTTEDSHFDGQHFSHFVNAGIRPEELPGLQDRIAALIADRVIDGITVRLDRGADLLAVAAELNAFAAQFDCDIIASVKLAGPSLARACDDNVDTARLAAEAIIASRTSQRVRYVFDTFMDIDRGYFPRNGFIDRSFNPREAANTVASMGAMLPAAGGATLATATQEGGCRISDFSVGEQGLSLLCGPASEVARQLGTRRTANAVNLLTREVIAADGSFASVDGMALVLLTRD
ncbi:metallophosphoesterase [Lacisediminimonas profundi]|uniref:metallophosphoesterase n=1 Tax=Lacisediminimonas profundi TaxID=2603856 RepID=UPI00138681C6|nr:metallophosphoesterase [Lacisediminimonas profundi]